MDVTTGRVVAAAAEVGLQRSRSPQRTGVTVATP
jgi:hypothetical protein